MSWRVELIERASVLVEWSNPLSDEWTVENAQSLLTDNADGTWEGGQDSVWLGGADPRGGLLAAFSSPENQSVKAMRAMKWPSEDALIYCALSWPRPRIAIARGLSTSDPSFAAESNKRSHTAIGGGYTLATLIRSAMDVLQHNVHTPQKKVLCMLQVESPREEYPGFKESAKGPDQECTEEGKEKKLWCLPRQWHTTCLLSCMHLATSVHPGLL